MPRIKSLPLLGAIGAWYGVSYYFLKNPNSSLLPIKKDKLKIPDKKLHLWAHRGGSMEAPENTLQSFLHAHRTGVDVIETDVRITKDGKIVVCHDADFTRLCKKQSIKEKLIRDTMSNELPVFKEKLPLHFGKDVSYIRQKGDQNTYTTLEEIFQVLPQDQLI